MVTYTYDAWGNPLSTTGSMASTLGALNPLNPLRYRGYVYDTETGLYYLQSRYYDPEVCRFINADSGLYNSLFGLNMFAYCENNPVNFIDKNGTNAEAIQQWASGMWWLCFADGVVPIGDVIYIGGIIIFGIILFAENDNSTPSDEAKEETGPTVPNNNNDDYDDYYDDSNYGGKQKIGTGKNNTPGNNKKQNKQFKDATKGLSKKQKRAVHDQISGKDYDFHEISEIAKSLLSLVLNILS